MTILFAASELAPFAKVGGLGDVMGGLPKAISASGYDVAVVIPKYEHIDVRHIKAKIVVKDFPVPLGNHQASRVNIYQTTLPQSRVSVYLVENKKYLSTGEIYFGRTAFAGSFKEIQRFLFFSKAVMALIAAKKLNANVVHCNDWHTGALANLIRRHRENSAFKTIPPKIIFTIHNLANQGIWNSKKVSTWFGTNTFKNSSGKFNFMAEGIRNADMITTVSESYSKEILTTRYGAGLEKLLKKRADELKLTGILNGVDYSMWPVPKRNKIGFQKMLGLMPDNKLPIFGLVSRLTYQKGIKLIVPLAREFAKKHAAQFVFLGRGEAESERALSKLAHDYPRNIFTKIDFNETLAHKIYAHSDFFLMPSIFEPSGLGQLISMHYGTVPIVRATGGLKDSVSDSKTGFVFKNADVKSLKSAMERALACYKNTACFRKITTQCRKKDFSWKGAAQKYIAVYLNSLRIARLEISDRNE